MTAEETPDAPQTAWVLSAPTAEGLARNAAELLHRVREDEALDVWAVARKLASEHRSAAHRAVVIGGHRNPLTAGLAALAAGESLAQVVRGTPVPGGLAYLFTFQGSQRLGMGRSLAAAVPSFRTAFAKVCGELEPHLPRPLPEVVFAAEETPEAALLEQTGWAAPAIFALEAALFRLLGRWGLRPDLVAGGSVGDFAAGYAAGLFDLADAAALVARRAQLMQALPEAGAMWSVRAPEQEVHAALRGLEDRACIGVLNGPESFVLAGERAAVATAAERLVESGYQGRALRVSHAFHSPLVEPMLAPFGEAAAAVSYRMPHTPLVDSLTGRRADPREVGSAEYWVRHVREPVRFRESVRHLEDSGVTTYLEIGPLAMQSLLVRGSLREPALAAAVPSLRHLRPEPWSLLHAVAQVHVRGAAVDWSVLLGDLKAGVAEPRGPRIAHV